MPPRLPPLIFLAVRVVRALRTVRAVGLVGLTGLLGVTAFDTPVDARADPTERRAVVFFTAETYGTLEPCGCTSDPLGDFARVTALIRREARARNALWVDAGNLSYPPTAIQPGQRKAAALRASFLAEEMQRLPFGGAALGHADLALGPSGVVPKRLAVNLPGAPFVEPSRIVDVGGIRIAVLGVVDPTIAELPSKAEDPAPAAAAEVERVRTLGAEVVILLAPLDRAPARRIARSAGADIVILGKGTGPGMTRAEPVGGAYLVAPADELQRIGRIDIVLRGKRAASEPLRDAGSAEQRRERTAELHQRIAELAKQVETWSKDSESDATFIAAKTQELVELRGEEAALARGWTAPAEGSYFTAGLISIRRALPRDPTLSSSMRKLDRAVGAANLAAAEAPAPAEPGRAFYVGDDACTSCHKPAARFWKKTVHAEAWKTLVEAGKEAHPECVSCHVTGFGEVGGTSLGHTRGFEDVQCEVCHGPGSTHVQQRGKESPFAGRLETPESVCVRCHNEKHSDTFQYAAYLRDVVGEGHGELARDKLGDGPTGRELRKAAMARAKAAGKRQVTPAAPRSVGRP